MRTMNDFGGFDKGGEKGTWRFSVPHRPTLCCTVSAVHWFDAREEASISLGCAPQDLESEEVK